MNRHFQIRVRAGVAVLIASLLALAFWPTVNPSVRASEKDADNYASPLEVLLTPDGARLYVL